MSIFQSIYSSSQVSNTFWKEINTETSCFQSKPVYFRHFLTFDYKNNGPKQYEVTLLRNAIFFNLSEKLVVYAKIKWALIEAFSEEYEKEFSYGFTIVFGSEKIDFYAENSQFLDMWLENLANFAIMTDFEKRFVILKKIDSGQYGTVYLTEDLVTNYQYAVKKIEKSSLCDKKVLNQLYNEIIILKKLDHPNIIKLYWVFEEELEIFMIMEYIPYGNLFQRVLKKQKICESSVRKFTSSMLEVMSYLQYKCIVHRDIKLENILMMSNINDYDFKIADFGLACYADGDIKTCSGSPGYIAPEILRNNFCTPKSDIFSLGIIIYTLLTGISPFRANHQKGIIEKNIKCKIDFCKRLFKGVSSDALEFLQEVLKIDHNKRPSADVAFTLKWMSEANEDKRRSLKSFTKSSTYASRESTNFTRSADRYLLTKKIIK